MDLMTMFRGRILAFYSEVLGSISILLFEYFRETGLQKKSKKGHLGWCDRGGCLDKVKWRQLICCGNLKWG